MTRIRQPIIKILKAPQDSQGTRILREFLIGTMTEFARLNENIYEACGAYPFEYAERQVQSVVFSSFVKISAYPYAEHPILRKRRTKPKRLGWVDFWTLYRNTVFLIEFKHAWSLFDSKNCPAWILKNWETAVKDVGTVTKESLKEMELGNKNLFELAMMTVRLEQKSETLDELRVIDEEEAAQQVRKLCENLNPEPSWIVCWVLRKELQQKHQKWEDKFWNYPAVYLCVWSQGPIDTRS